MNVFSVMYHDVVENGAWDSSGFPGDGAAVYKLERAEFGRHLDSVKSAGVLVGRASEPLVDGSALLTFDDGGVSAHARAPKCWSSADGLATSSSPRIGSARRDSCLKNRSGTFAAEGISLSHSCSHPTRMAQCTRDELRREWQDSVNVLQDILGETVPVASVPGGYYSRMVGETAAEAGIRVLFNSEPTASVSHGDECLLLGRYFIQRGMPAGISGAFASGSFGPRFKQAAFWQLKKAAKAAGGGAYLRLREKILKR